RFTTLAHAGRAILGPLDDADLDAVLADLPVEPASRVLDIGCGKGELLVRLAARGASGVGIDHNPWHLRDARARAAKAGVTGRLDWDRADARAARIADPFHVVASIGASGALGGAGAAPGALAALVRPGGHVLIGEGFWRAAPDPADAAAFGIGPDEMLPLAATLARMTGAGLALAAVHEATDAAWERYETGYAAAIDDWAAAHPADPERHAFLERASVMRATWAAWRRDAMGFAVAVLRRA
ncbi:MAG: SAM-dependent methyltransferase, partial [Chloroflexota bacterium]